MAMVSYRFCTVPCWVLFVIVGVIAVECQGKLLYNMVLLILYKYNMVLLTLYVMVLRDINE